MSLEYEPSSPSEFIPRLQIVHRVSSSLLVPLDPSFRALSRRLKFTVRRHQFVSQGIACGRIVGDKEYKGPGWEGAGIALHAHTLEIDGAQAVLLKPYLTQSNIEWFEKVNSPTKS